MDVFPFHRYQQAFADHIRCPDENPRPAGVAEQCMQVYIEIVFNNLLSSVNACFPVLKGMLGQDAWERLVRGFLAHYPAQSPFFRDIPRQFVDYLQALPELPPFAAELAHYEWMELVLSAEEVHVPAYLTDGDHMSEIPVIAPALAILSYRYPVHRLSKDNFPQNPEPVHLLMYRNPDDEVKFIELSLASARLIEYLRQGVFNGLDALKAVGNDIGMQDIAALLAYGEQLLNELRQQGVIWGTLLVSPSENSQ